MKKILIIGQAPPAVKQEVPYDTTMLYDMLSWVGITKEQAQEMFEFEALTDVFPGFENGNHKIPTIQQKQQYFDLVLKDKIIKSEKVWLLGKQAFNFITEKQYDCHLWDKKVLSTIHPSKRNHARIMANKERLTQQIKNFIEE